MKLRVGERQSSVPEGEYQAIVKDIRTSKNFNRDVFEFLFEIVDGPHKGVQARGFCNADYEAFTSHTKLYHWYEMVTKDALTTGDELDTDDFYNKVLIVRVETKVSKKTKNEFSNVTEIVGVKDEL